MVDTVQLQITSCEQCPKRKTERHYTGDSFEHVTAWKCSTADGRVIDLHEWNDPVPAIPQWCPLRSTAGVGDKHGN
jgi:hypothetical protein